MTLSRLPTGVAVIALLLIAPAGAGDWPQWHGPNRDNISTETGLLQEWPQNGPELVWKAEGLGAGFSSVSVAGDKIFSMGDKEGESCALALNRSDGKLLWTTPIGKAGAPGWGGHKGTRSTPTVDGELVFVIGEYGELVCLQAATGKKIWQKHLIDDFKGKLPEWGYSESPLVDGDKVICTPGGKNGTMLALDKKTGNLIWQTSDITDNASYASIIPADIGKIRQYIQLTDQHVFAVGTNGKILWQAKRKGKVAVVPTPICHDNKVYVCSGYNIGDNLFEITPANATFTVREVYNNKIMVNHHGGVLLYNGHLYGHSDTRGWVCQEFNTGKLVWNEEEKFDKGSLTCADAHLYLRSEGKEGTVALIEATPKGYIEKGRFNQPYRSKAQSWPHPVIAGAKLYLRDQDILLCYDIKEK
ncbi:MAG: PQQ-like beta-propeller repeat protein [Sedimentisphaerales bacterium]|nr:PQQ-like beta-propeller repeat protein [Sedimentisphaerales bacterium]